MKSDWAPTEILLQHLRQLDDAPWSDMNPPLTGHRMGKLLGEFGVKSARNPERTKRGYARSVFVDAWERYPAQDSADQASEPSEPSGSVPTLSDQQEQADTSPDALDAPLEASGEVSGHSHRSDPVRTLPDGSDAWSAGTECHECGKVTQRDLLGGLCRSCHFAERAVS